MSASVELNVILRDGTKTSFSHPAGIGDPCVDIKTLQKSLSSLQQESNAFLTKLVEQEKSSVLNGNQSNQNVNRTDDDEDEESEDSDEQEKDKEPVKKKQKT